MKVKFTKNANSTFRIEISNIYYKVCYLLQLSKSSESNEWMLLLETFGQRREKDLFLDLFPLCCIDTVGQSRLEVNRQLLNGLDGWVCLKR